MTAADIATLIATAGGMQVLVEAVKWWRSRHLHDRQDTAVVVASENDNYRRHVDWLEARLEERDKKIDHIYDELRAEQAARLEEMHRRHEAELRAAEAEVRKCNMRGCKDRIPPSDY